MNADPAKVDCGMSPESGERTAGWVLCVLKQIGNPVRKGARVLEIGCGNGEMVHALRDRGIDALGCDLRFKSGPRTASLRDAHLLKLIEIHPYRLPFEDASFDFVVSVSVLEHVINLGETVQEMARVTRQRGAGLHMFPSRYRPLEPHTHVPLATLLRARGWLRFWALMGVRNSYQRNLKSGEIAEANYKYLRESTTYLSRRCIRRAFQKEFANVRFCEDLFVSCGTGALSNRMGLGRAMQFSGLLTRLYSAARSRVICVEKQ